MFVFHSIFTAIINAEKQISHRVTGPDAPLKVRIPILKDRSPSDVEPRMITTHVAVIADNGMRTVAGNCVSRIFNSQLDFVEVCFMVWYPIKLKKRRVAIIVPIHIVQFAICFNSICEIAMMRGAVLYFSQY